jgi:carboxylesterase
VSDERPLARLDREDRDGLLNARSDPASAAFGTLDSEAGSDLNWFLLLRQRVQDRAAASSPQQDGLNLPVVLRPMTHDIMPGCEPFSHLGGRSGVLVLHGFTGNPASMRSIAERAAQAGYSVELPCLPGHGTTVEDMITTTWTDWSKTAEATYDELTERCERVAVIGLSMGGGLAAHVAEVRPSVAGCVFINPLVKSPGPEMLEGIKVMLESGVETFESIGSDIKREGAVENSYAATPLAPAKSLFDGIVAVHENLNLISAPSLLISSREDHVVTSQNGDDLEAMVTGPVERVWLENSYHVATMDNDQELVESLTLDFLARVL